MSTAYAGDDTNYPTEITIPSDGDDKASTSVDVSLEGLADRTAHLAKIVSRPEMGSVVRVVPELPIITEVSGSPSWTQTFGLKLTQVDIDALGSPANGFWNLLRVPHGSTLVSVTAYLKGAAGHAVLPAVPPAVNAYRQLLSTGAAAALIGAADDASASTAAFEAVHAITALVNQVIDNSQYVYLISFSGERDIDTSVVGAIFYGFTYTTTVAKLDPGAS